MNSKRRKRAAIWGALLALMCLTVIPGTSSAFAIKWYFVAGGEPDEPGSGTYLIKIGGWSLSLQRVAASAWVLLPVSHAESARSLPR